MRLWADALDAKDLTAAERAEIGPTIWRARAIADDPSTHKDRDFVALVKELERAYGRWRSDSEPDPPGPTAAAPEACRANSRGLCNSHHAKRHPHQLPLPRKALAGR